MQWLILEEKTDMDMTQVAHQDILIHSVPDTVEHTAPLGMNLIVMVMAKMITAIASHKVQPLEAMTYTETTIESTNKSYSKKVMVEEMEEVYHTVKHSVLTN
jgi:hypothetical protein